MIKEMGLRQKSFKGLIVILLIFTTLTLVGCKLSQGPGETNDNSINDVTTTNTEKTLASTNTENKNDNCPYDECLNDGYYVIYSSGTNSSYSNGCQSEDLENAIDKCILKIGDIYVAPGSTDVTKSHWDKSEGVTPKKDGDICENNCDLYDDSKLNGDITSSAILDGDYGSAAQYCAQLTGGGLDWRLPSMGHKDNMGTGVDLQEGLGNGGLADIYAAFDNDMLIGLKVNEYWSSTYHEQIKNEAAWWLRFFDSGNTGTKSARSSIRVRCISESK